MRRWGYFVHRHHRSVLAGAGVFFLLSMFGLLHAGQFSGAYVNAFLNAIPEPTAIGMISAGMIFFGARSRRSRVGRERASRHDDCQHHRTVGSLECRVR